MHVSPWKALPNTSHIEAERERKVYLKRKTIHYLQMKSKESWLSVIPIECYLKGSLIKIRVALCKWKKQYQKKDMLKRKTVEKDIRRAMSKSY
jgi:SsrA-binding protein